MPAQFLRDQLSFYGLQAESVEQWKGDHIEAMACRNIEDAIRQGLSVLAGIRRHNALWAEEIERSERSFSWEDSAWFARMYADWLNFGGPVLSLIGACEARLFCVDGAKDFRDACREVSMMPLDIEHVRESTRSLETGNGIPLCQAMHALRTSLR